MTEETCKASDLKSGDLAHDLSSRSFPWIYRLGDQYAWVDDAEDEGIDDPDEWPPRNGSGDIRVRVERRGLKTPEEVRAAILEAEAARA